ALQAGLQSGQFPFIDRAWQWIQQRAPEQGMPDVATMVREGGEQVLTFLASKIGAVLKNVAVFLFDLIVVIFAMFYLFRDASRIVGVLRNILPFEPAHRDRMIEQARELINASVTSSLIIAAVQGLMGGILFAALGIRAPIFWGVVMAFLSLLPLVGPSLVWIPAAIWLVAIGEWPRAIILAGVGAGLVGTVDNFLRPYLIGDKARLSGLIVFVAVLGGIGVFGMLGVILGPIVVATAASMLEIYTKPQPKKPVAETAAPRPRPMLE
ncbi:MAG TPA: AI-2E family transporter, partial [Candidatus Acidoferrales bacterium]